MGNVKTVLNAVVKKLIVLISLFTRFKSHFQEFYGVKNVPD